MCEVANSFFTDFTGTFSSIFSNLSISLEIRRCDFLRCSASSKGGAVYAAGPSTNISCSSFDSCLSNEEANSLIVFQNCEVKNCVSINIDSSTMASFSFESNCVLKYLNFSKSNAYYFPAFRVVYGSSNASYILCNENMAQNGIIVQFQSNSDVCYVNNCVFTNNDIPFSTASYKGILRSCMSSVVSLTDCFFRSNTLAGSQAGILNLYADLNGVIYVGSVFIDVSPEVAASEIIYSFTIPTILSNYCISFGKTILRQKSSYLYVLIISVLILS